MTNFTRSEKGSSLVEVAIFLPLLLTLLLAVVDLGRAYYQADEVAGAAHAGAMYGTQHATDTTNMQNVAKDNAPDVSGMTATATYGCECADGSSASASCATTPSCSGSAAPEVYYVKVTTSATYSPLIPWPKFASSFTISNTVQMRTSGS